MPSFSWFVKDTEKCYSICDFDKSEKELDNSEEKEFDKSTYFERNYSSRDGS